MKRKRNTAHEEICEKYLKLLKELKPDDMKEASVEKLCKKLKPKTSLSTLERAFSEAGEEPPKYHLAETKFDLFESLVKSLIKKNKAETVKDALEIMGIESQSHFTKRYNKSRGKTPGRLLKEIKQAKKIKKARRGPQGR